MDTDRGLIFWSNTLEFSFWIQEDDILGCYVVPGLGEIAGSIQHAQEAWALGPIGSESKYLEDECLEMQLNI